MIPQRNLSLIANDLARAAQRRIPESVIERDYVLAWLLTGLAGHPLRDVLAFKGGTALRRCWFDHYRFSEDLDFTLTSACAFADVLKGLDEIFVVVHNACGLRIEFEREDRHGHQNSHTFYLGYQGPLPTRNNVKVDITIKERLCFPLQDKPVLQTYAQFGDLTPGPTLRTYSLEEIVVEKLVALSDKARNEPRDLYDLWYLISTRGLVIQELRPELEEKLAFRGRTTVGFDASVAGKEKTLERLWGDRLSRQMVALPTFDEAFRDVQRAIRAAKFPKLGGSGYGR